MNRTLQTVAVVPAKKRSVRVPGKNLKPLRGKPLLYYAVRVGQLAHLVDQVFVSTDCDLTADVARQFGATVIPRPAALAQDDTTTHAVLVHAYNWMGENGFGSPPHLLLLQATNPLRFPETLDAAVRSLQSDPTYDSLVSVKEVRDAWGRLDGERFLPAYELPSPKRDRAPIYFMTHNLYLFRTATTMARDVFLGERIKAFLETELYEVDINTQADFDYAEYLLEKHARRFSFFW
jgi:CMP-N,N'-diacetyllegionaminic acid synthase